MMNERLYFYKAQVTRAVDGDTFHALVDLGFGIKIEKTFRLARIDAEELRSLQPEGIAKARAALAFVNETLIGKPAYLQCKSTDKFGRGLAEVWVNDVNLSDTMLEKGLAKPYK